MTTPINPPSAQTGKSPREISDIALGRERQWRIFFAVCAGVFWLLLAASVIGFGQFIFTFITPVYAHLDQYVAGGIEIKKDQMQQLALSYLVLGRVLQYGSIAVAVLLAMSVGMTLLYIRATHRANLRRVSQQLAEISSQLRQLKEEKMA